MSEYGQPQFNQNHKKSKLTEEERQRIMNDPNLTPKQKKNLLKQKSGCMKVIFILLIILAAALIINGFYRAYQNDAEFKAGVDKTKEDIDYITGNGKEVKDEDSVAKTDFPDSETGNGTFNLMNVSGSTADGKEVIFFYKDDYKDGYPETIGYSTREIDGQFKSYIYVDGVLSDTDQLADSDGALGLSDKQLDIGSHAIQLVQYDNNQEDGNIITYKLQHYEIKE
jgi:hypothetical protein